KVRVTARPGDAQDVAGLVFAVLKYPYPHVLLRYEVRELIAAETVMGGREGGVRIEVREGAGAIVGQGRTPVPRLEDPVAARGNTWLVGEADVAVRRARVPVDARLSQECEARPHGKRRTSDGRCRDVGALDEVRLSLCRSRRHSLFVERLMIELPPLRGPHRRELVRRPEMKAAEARELASKRLRLAKDQLAAARAGQRDDDAGRSAGEQ